MTAPGLAAVLFDMDGTLVDSEQVWGVGLRELAARYGGELSEPARLAIVGTSSMQTMQILLADLGQSWRDPVEGAQWLDSRVLELFAEGLHWRPGAHDLLHQVRRHGLPSALVSNTKRALVEVALQTLGAHNFDVLVCGDEVARTKPDPLPYLTAAANLGVDPRWCVAIEDSPAGIASAHAAGCAVIAVPQEVPAVPPFDGVALNSLLEADLALLHEVVLTRAGRPPR
ncbi:MAG TPA: HAD family phosphatase [Micromonosporaceae bacterium]